MLGVAVNVIAIIVGTLLGVLLKKALSDNIKNVVMSALGISIIGVSILDIIKTPNVIILVLSLSLGGLLGAIIKIQDKFDKFGEFLQKKISKDENSTVGEAFVTSSILYCIGAMVIYGSIKAGLGDNTTLYLKATLDGLTAVLLAATLGYGVMLSAIPVLIIQSTFVLLSSHLSQYASVEFLNMLSGIGGSVVFCIGLNLLNVTKIKTADLIPAILGSIAIFFIK